MTQEQPPARIAVSVLPVMGSSFTDILSRIIPPDQTIKVL
jgi:hypothetical protein